MGRRAHPCPTMDRMTLGVIERACAEWAGHLTPWAVAARIRKATGYNPHALRRRFATQVYRRTHDLRAVQVMLGHASVATTQRYVAVGSSRLAAVAAASWAA